MVILPGHAGRSMRQQCLVSELFPQIAAIAGNSILINPLMVCVAVKIGMAAEVSVGCDAFPAIHERVLWVEMVL